MASPAPPSLLVLLARQSKTALVSLVVGSFAVNLLTLVSPIYMLQVYDRVLPSRSMATLGLLTVMMIGLFMVMALVEHARGRIMHRLALQVSISLSRDIFDAVFRRNLRRAQGGAAARAFQDVDALRQFLSGPGIPAFVDLPWAPLFIAAAYLIAPAIGHITLAAVIVLLLVTLWSELATRRAVGEATNAAGAATSFAEGALLNASTIAALGMLDPLRERWKTSADAALAFQMQAADRSMSLSSLTRFIRITVQSLVLGVGAWLAIDQQITPGEMIAGSIILGRGLAPVEHVVGAWRGYLAARNASRRIGELLGHFPAPAMPAVALPPPEGNLAVERLVAGAPDGTATILKGISLRVPAGQTVAIIGPSGAGKSTLARCLVGAWPAVQGTVRLDGAALSEWPADVLGRNLGYLSQEIELFEGTVAENIARFGALDSEKVVAAAQLAGVHDLVLRLPDGYDTAIGAAGRILSGGQRQRVALARALYGDPRLVVLDEPNANLDSDGEAALAAALRLLRQRGTTVIVISHRVALVGQASRTLVMREGAIELDGPTAEIVAKLRNDGGAAGATPRVASGAAGPA